MKAKNQIYSHREDLFDQWTEESTYLLGYLEADGYLLEDKETIRVCIQTSDKDKEFIQMLYSLTGFTGKLGKYNNKANGKTYKKLRFTVSSRAWKNSLLYWHYRRGCLPPIPNNLIHHYIRGYFDGDGSIFWSKQAQHLRSNFVFNSTVLAESFANYLRSITNSKLNIHRKTTSNRCWYFNCGNKATINLMRYMYKDAKIYLQRKHDLAYTLL